MDAQRAGSPEGAGPSHNQLSSVRRKSAEPDDVDERSGGHETGVVRGEHEAVRPRASASGAHDLGGRSGGDSHERRDHRSARGISTPPVPMTGARIRAVPVTGDYQLDLDALDGLLSELRTRVTEPA